MPAMYRSRSGQSGSWPFLLRFAWECNGQWYPWAAGTSGNTPASCIAAYQHIAALARTHAPNARLAWCVGTSGSGWLPLESCWPGDAWVDVLALDFYNTGPAGWSGSWQPFSAIQPWNDRIAALSPTKPILVAETGCAVVAGQDKAAWYAAIPAALTTMPRLVGIVAFDNKDSAFDFRVSADPAVYAAWKALTALPVMHGRLTVLGGNLTMATEELLLIDLSSNNLEPYDFHAVKAAGYTGVIVKVTQGTDFVNPYFAATWPAIKVAGLWRGLYHFCRADLNAPEAEAAWLLAHLPPLDPYDGVALDYEVLGNAGAASPSDWVLRCGIAVEQGIGFANLLLYLNGDFARNYLTDPALRRFNLWLASWDIPSIPAGIGVWSTIALWQFSATGSVPGISGPVDLSKLARDLAGLRALGKPAPVQPPPFVPQIWTAKKKFGLLSRPQHGSLDLIDVPAGATGRTEQARHTDAQGNEWWGAQFRDKHGYLLRANIQV
jgi:GH25 family lysozyme M1 (1,4-beta-N-acetylmuramidase)